MSDFKDNPCYQPDDPPKHEWIDDDRRFWYEERPRMILHYYKPDYPGVENMGSRLSAFVNMNFNPTPDKIAAFMERGLRAAGIQGKVANLRFRNWSDGTTGAKGVRSTDAFWDADFIEEASE